MKAELETKSLELLNWLEQGIKNTVDFASEQVPLFIQELLRYHYWTSLTMFILFIVGLILTVYGGYRFVKWLKADNWDNFPFMFLFLVPLAICVGGGS